MKRRLDLASALVHEPEVLFLDEPTTGLDPASRLTVWDEVRRINELGTTVFLTTQYLEEADQLCDRLAIIDGGLIVREGTPAELKAELRERRGLTPSRRSTTCSSTPRAARAAASRATCRRCGHEPGLGARAARAAGGAGGRRRRSSRRSSSRCSSSSSTSARRRRSSPSASTEFLYGQGYGAFQLPASLLLAASFGTAALFLVEDIEGGYFDKLRATPISRTAIVLGRLIAEGVKAVLISVAIVLLGARVRHLDRQRRRSASCC